MYKRLRATMIRSIEQICEIVGYAAQYILINIRNRMDKIVSPSLVFAYGKLVVFDTIDYYYTYLILSLPLYMFGSPIIRIKQVSTLDLDSSDDDTEPETKEYDVFVSQLVFVHKSNDTPPLMSMRVMNGLQLRPLIDDKGRFFIGHIERYYPSLDSIILKYVKFPAIDKPIEQLLESQSSSQNPTEIKVIDVAKRYDIRNSKSCKFGVYL